MADMNKMMKECFTPHVLVHSLTGLGVGLVLVAILPDIFATNALILGVIAIVVGFVFDFMVNPAAKK